jgi:hypothetical protein
MTSDDQHPDLNQPSAWAPPDLAALAAHPSMASLRGRGWRLDHLPADSTAWAFVCALLAGFVVYGVNGAAIVIAWSFLTVPLAALELVTRDLRRARLALNVARYGLVAMLLGIVALAATVSGLPSLDGHSPSPSGAPPAASVPTQPSGGTSFASGPVFGP